MPDKVNARELVGSGFPPEEGAKLARALLARGATDWDALTVDVRDLPASLLISSFFNGFLQRVHNDRPTLLSRARQITWQPAYPFQEERVARWMKAFEPRDNPPTQH